MAADHARPIVPPKQLKTDYPLIDSDPHVRRVFGYARPSDYIMGAGVTVVSPLLFGIMERVQPAASGAINYTRCMRLAGAVGLAAGIITVYQRSSNRFYGLTENSREEEMDMREMVDKIKKGEPLYGTSVLSPYMQGVAARNSRYTSLFIHVIPWFNVVNHNQHGVDTAKYYRQAERELEAEREKMMASQ
ncbi:hypothetical protein H112_00102 [Trichophyton rubrum D6]|uniref:NADH-ubiquinone oxidoreductase 21 kDa subunit n=3 Tax=Trichophyton TaxID=5550 RepID=F2T164_TRIRC|nr:uncharacterized protein TERG_08551 [Trichophyton rubrum CBS 118892]EZF28005.1 hypothetical protein H100_00101 [Trichophyton rubrum MR850]EZF47032.1 hypothetical protein H102_00100 [Trichophyton rubrum CBS 100081]EZF57687.1 hypothetical protein H103_00102 [Trichophyton rubrum CBS 288.86]EZF68291.1 hypothetical protein H104_00100 [Trichophyton rubrum CBS 289.86]EZF78961.1 hypothetical protein H105_00092 [Trichophyton soudanense CBS 452.61]EZF89607.1 hypothetical protein H110_00102 [Trichophy